jgi:hypothetical protein
MDIIQAHDTRGNIDRAIIHMFFVLVRRIHVFPLVVLMCQPMQGSLQPAPFALS